MLRVGVIMGGNSSEREISLLTGQAFIEHLDRQRYQVIEIIINRPKDILDFKDQMDVGLLALHGKNGEDGKVQALLEALEIPYSGSGIASSALCLDKNMSKLIMKSQGVLTPKWVMAKKNYFIDQSYFSGLRFPVIVKPNQGGSSIGIQIVKDIKMLEKVIEATFALDEEVIVEEFIQGKEITCSMIKGEIIPVISIQPTMIFYDYDAKYTDNEHICGLAQLEEEELSQIKEVAKQCWHLFKMKSYGRIDLIINDAIHVIEINTLPGMTHYSHLPKSAEAMGLSYTDMLNQIIEDALT